MSPSAHHTYMHRPTNECPASAAMIAKTLRPTKPAWHVPVRTLLP